MPIDNCLLVLELYRLYDDAYLAMVSFFWKYVRKIWLWFADLRVVKVKTNVQWFRWMRFHDFAFPNELLLGESYCVDEMMCVFLSERERETHRELK